MKHYGLIGQSLSHSWSADFFAKKFECESIDADYRLLEVPVLTADAVDGLNNKLDGYNVTIPYKERIIPFLRALEPVAAAIGAVNVVKNGVGYNSDWIGFKTALREACEQMPANALVLGQGGAAKAIAYALNEMGIANEMISARGLDNLDVTPFQLIVNATPLGMYPDVKTFPNIDYESLTPKHVLFDCVYNPAQTEFLRRGKVKGAIVIGGLRMLEEQAEASWRLWNN